MRVQTMVINEENYCIDDEVNRILDQLGEKYLRLHMTSQGKLVTVLIEYRAD